MLFLPIVFLFYWFVFRQLRWQNLFLVVASYVFYGWWNASFLFLIAFTTLCSYLSGIGIGYVRSVNECKLGGWIN
jgi:D-alanyl-lipoteichoic acid acyltransferase DltB (MBOAT superfamily)